MTLSYSITVLQDSPLDFPSMKHLKLSALPALMTIAILWLVGCASNKPSGYIYLDHGEVFTRQRLLNDRLNNLSWLNSELNNTPSNSTIQGGRFQGETTSINTGLSAQFNPLAAAGAGAVQQLMQSQTQLAQMQSQVTMAALQQQLQGLTNGTLSYSNIFNQPAAGTNALGSALSLASSFAPSNVVTGAPTSINIVNGVSTNGTLPSGLIPSGPNAPQLTSVETFQDQLAYRDAVAGEIQEQELDDTHDQSGMTLYTLAFHLSVAPGDNNRHFGHIAAGFTCTDDDTNVSESDYETWLEVFRQRFDNEVISIQRRYLQGLISDDEKRRLVVDVWMMQDKNQDKIRRLLDEINLRLKSSDIYLDDAGHAHDADARDSLNESMTNVSNKLEGCQIQLLEAGNRLATNNSLLLVASNDLTAARTQLTNSSQKLYLTGLALNQTNQMLLSLSNNLASATNNGFMNHLRFFRGRNSGPAALAAAGKAVARARDSLQSTLQFLQAQYNDATNRVAGDQTTLAAGQTTLDRLNREIIDLSQLVAAYQNDQQLLIKYSDLHEERQDLDSLLSFTPPTADNADTESAMRALCWVEIFRFNQLTNVFPHLFVLEAPSPVGVIIHDTNDFKFLVPVKGDRDLGGSNGWHSFVQARQWAESNAVDRTFVYAIQPKEYAQNFADSSVKQSVLNASLGLSALIPQAGTTISAYLDYLRQNQYLLEAIKRKPLLTGFIEGARGFGWLLGPRFKIEDKELDLGYEQIAEQEAVQVTLEVPAWWSAVEIITTNEWLNAWGKPVSRRRAPGITHTNIVELRPDLDALTSAWLCRADPNSSQPQIYPDWHPNRQTQGYALVVGQSAQIVIRGRNLWRNPQIFIGTQSVTGDKNYNYQVLPDMGGLIVYVDQVQQPPNLATNSSAKADLRVITSDGEALLRDAVTIYSGLPQANSPSPAYVQMTNFFGVIGGTISFPANTNVVVPFTTTYQLALGATSQRPAPVPQPAVMAQNGVITFAMPTNNAAPWTNAAYARVDVWAQMSPTAEPVSVLAGGEQTFVVFTNNAQGQFIFTTNLLNISTNTAVTNAALVVSLPAGVSPDLFWNARPGLQAALQTGTASLTLTNAGGSAPLTSSAFTTNNQLIFTLPSGTNAAPFVRSLHLQNTAAAAAVTNTAVIQIPAGTSRWTIPVASPINFYSQ
jgi:hypothetical protein